MKSKTITFVILLAFFSSSLTGNSFAQFERTPKGPPDLIIKSATFYFSKVVVVVENVGKGRSSHANLALEILAGKDPSSNSTDKYNRLVPALAPGKTYEVEFDVGNRTFANHARRVMIDDTNVVAESNERNNGLFSNSDPVAEQADFPDAANFSDLTFSMVKFIAPSSVHYCVKNIGNEPSSSYKVRTTIFNGPKKDSGVASMTGPYAKNPFTLPGNSLKAGESACQDFTFATYDGSALESRGRLIEIIPDDPAKDADKNNNSYFSGGIEPLWHK